MTRGVATLLWRRAVADLETPVAAFLKLAHGKPNTFLLESVEGGASRGRYSIIGLEARPGVALPAAARRAEPARAVGAVRLRRGRAPGPGEPARGGRRVALDVPDGLPPMCGGLIGYLGYDMVRLMERLPDKNQAAIDVPDALLARPTLFAIFDNVTDLLTLAAPVYPRDGVSAEAAWHAAQAALEQAEAAMARPLPLAAPPVALPPLPAPVVELHPRGIHCRGGAGQGIHPRRRRLPDRAEPAILGAVRAAAVLALPGAAADQSGAVPVLPRFRRLRRGRLQPGNPGAAARRHRDHPPAGRHPPRAARRTTKTRRWRPNCWPIRRSGPST